MNTLVLGIDVSKDKLDVVLLQAKDPTHMIFENDGIGHRKLLRWLAKRAKDQQVHACMEATGMYAFPAAEALHQAGYTVSVVNPARIHAYAKSLLNRNKTDKKDAYIIADFCRTQQPPAWQPPGPEYAELRALVRLLADLKHSRQADHNRLNSGIRSAAVAAILQDHIAYLDHKTKELEQQIKAHIDRFPDLKRQKQLLVSIPGIGELTACKLLAEIPDIRNFENAKQLAAFAGLNPKHRQSGKMKGRSPISRMGSADLRTTLYMPAIVAKKHNPSVRAFCHRLEKNGKLPMEIVVAAMRKLLHIAFGVLKNGQPFDPNYEIQFNFAAVSP
jgi:transposase